MMSGCLVPMQHLYWHKGRQTVLDPKINALPDDHSLKSNCLFQLAKLSQSVGNHSEEKRLLSHVLRLYRERGSDLETTW